MKYGKVLTYKDAEEAKKLVGKKVVYSDYLDKITEIPETRFVSVLESINCTVSTPFMTSAGSFQFIREVIKEEEPQIMTNRQLSEWCGKRNGEITCTNSSQVFSYYVYLKDAENKQIPDDIRIRSWDFEEWVLPTVDIYERDCKGGNK